jgi:serine/threonine protein kinase
MLSLEGKQLGNYDIIKRIRVGGMGAVYEGRQRTAFGRRVAIKVILGDYANDRAMQRRFAREAQTIAGLQHAHILPLIEFGEAQGILYLVMPFVDGGTLTSYLRHNLLDLEEVSTIFQQLLDAVEYAHDKGLIHRDIKSSNVLLELRRNTPPHLYLADFGLVRSIQQDATSQTARPIPLDQVPGTPHYMAPEQTRGIVTPLTDIYALGVLLYQMLTGTLPYNDPDDVCVIQMHLQEPIPLPSAVDASIPSELDAVVSTAMAKHPEDRYCNVADLRAGFLAALHGSSRVKMIPMPRRSPITALPQSLRLHVPRRADSSDHKLPEPIIIRQHLRHEHTLMTVRQLHQHRERLRTSKNKARFTEEPQLQRWPYHHLRLAVPAALFALILVLLLGALIVPRKLGIKLIPSSTTFETATVSVTAQTKMEKNSYLLTASTQQTMPDLTTRTIPARLLQDTLTDSKTVSTSGIDSQMSHYVTQADLDGVNASLEPALEQQMALWFHRQLAANEVIASVPSYKVETDPNIPVNGQADQVQITIKIQGSVTIYNRATCEQLAAQLLSLHITKELGKAYKQHGPISIVGTPVQDGGSDSLIYLSIIVRGIWVYAFTSAQINQWQQSIKGTNSTQAKAYLHRQPGVASVTIHLPLNTDHLPSSVDRIRIIVQG